MKRIKLKKSFLKGCARGKYLCDDDWITNGHFAILRENVVNDIEMEPTFDSNISHSIKNLLERDTYPVYETDYLYDDNGVIVRVFCAVDHKAFFVDERYYQHFIKGQYDTLYCDDFTIYSQDRSFMVMVRKKPTKMKDWLQFYV